MNLTASRQKNFRNKGRLHTTGKLYRGCVQEASAKVFIGCIPANYETIVYRVESVKSFGSSQTRFNSAKQSTPGPGHYFDETADSSISKEVVTVPHEGTSSMLSKTKREFNSSRRGNVLLGPGRYNIESSFPSKKEDDPKFYAFNFEHRQLKAMRPNPQSLPGPGQYEITKDLAEKYRQTYKSAFKSRQVRSLQAAELGPGPGDYNSKMPRKVSRRYIFPESRKKQVLSPAHLIDSNQPRTTLGPGIYDLSQPDFTPYYQKVKNSGNFIQGLMDRFGNVAPDYEELKSKVVKRPPGPGEYFKESKGDEKEPRQTCVFFSKTVRKVLQPKKDAMGPNLEEIKPQGKKEFRLLMDGVWA